MGKSFKDFDVCKSFKHKFKDKILKYIDELYDQRSSFNNITNLMERKKAICNKVGLDPDIVKKDILEMNSESFCNLVFHYQSFYKNSNIFHQLINDQHLFWGMQMILSTPVPIGLDENEAMDKFKKRSEISRLSSEVQKRINEYLSAMYKDDDAMKEVAENNIRRTVSMEDWILKMKEKEAENVQSNNESISI